MTHPNPDEKAPDPAGRGGGMAAMRDRFVARVKARETVVGVIGLGYVGLPLVLAFGEAGFRTIGFDVDGAKVAALTRDESYIRHVPAERVAALRGAGRLDVTSDFARAAEADALLICVPTPLGPYREPDTSFVEATARAIGPHLRPGQLVSLESTTYPSTTQDLLADALGGGGLVANRDFALAYSPEREDPGNTEFTTADIPKVVGADRPEAGDMAETLYAAIVGRVVRMDSTRAAEAVKLTENIFRSVNIALVNELKLIFERMGIDVHEVIDAAKTKPFGFMPFYPGPGIGGHCIPIDPFYLTWKAREHGMHTRFIELAGEINSAMPDHVVTRLVEALSEHVGKPIRGARVLVVGLAYKRNVDDVRESPSMILIERLRGRGAEVAYHDPFVPAVPPTREHMDLAGMRSAEWSGEALSGFDAAIVATDHDGLDLDLLRASVPLIVDTRGAMRNAPEGGAVVVGA